MALRPRVAPARLSARGAAIAHKRAAADRRRRLPTLLAANLVLAGCAGGPKPDVTAGPQPRLVQPSPVSPPQMRYASCAEPAWAAQPARANAATLSTLPWSGFGRAESGWAIYAPSIAVEAASSCPGDSPGFAADLLRWQTAHGLPATGAVDIGTLETMKAIWQARRPFVALRAQNVCPDPPSPDVLDTAHDGEGLGGKPVQLRRDAMAAYRRMAAAARAEVPEIAADPQLLTLFSGFRSPEYDDARCERDGNCQGIVRAACSGHRTGTATDIDVGNAPGYAVDASADANRLAQVRGPAYRWLLTNARRFGFVPYAFEPWHWEWTGTGTPGR